MALKRMGIVDNYEVCGVLLHLDSYSIGMDFLILSMLLFFTYSGSQAGSIF